MSNTKSLHKHQTVSINKKNTLFIINNNLCLIH